MKLRTKFAIALLIATILLSGATFGGLELYKNQQISSTEESINESATLTADQIGAEISRTRDYVGYVASRPEAANFNQSDDYVDDFLANSRFYAAMVVVENGTAITFRGGVTEEAKQNVIGSDLSDVEYVSSVLNTGEIYMSPPEYANATEKYLTIISAPIFDENSEITGVFAAAIYIDTTTFFTMVAPLETSSQAVQITAGEDTTLHPNEQNFTQPLKSSAIVQPVGWEVTVTHDASALRTQLRNLAIAQGAGLFIVLSLVVVFGYWQYATNLRQTERLLAGFQELERGDYEYSLSLGAGEEWVKISDGFNHLSTGLKRREEQLRERQQRLEVLYRVLRHNLRNEMSIIQNYADIIKDMTEQDPLEDAARTILDAGSALIGLSEQAREIQNAMEDAGTDIRAFDAARIVDSVTQDLREDYPEVDISVTLPDEAWVEAIGALETAIEELGENACKHNDADEPAVDITVEADAEDAVKIVIADTGPGIPEQERNVLEKGRETSLEHGSGLGLWLVYWIIDKSGGHLEFDENEPRGSIVTVELNPGHPDEQPVGDADEAEVEEAEEEPPEIEADDD